MVMILINFHHIISQTQMRWKGITADLAIRIMHGSYYSQKKIIWYCQNKKKKKISNHFLSFL